MLDVVESARCADVRGRRRDVPVAARVGRPARAVSISGRWRCGWHGCLIR